MYDHSLLTSIRNYSSQRYKNLVRHYLREDAEINIASTSEIIEDTGTYGGGDKLHTFLFLHFSYAMKVSNSIIED